MVFIALFAIGLSANAAEVVYKIVEYNKTIGEFALSASGVVPQDSWAYFENDFGATTGNRYNQIPRNRQAVLYLAGWEGCTIRSITLSMCSNSKKGQVGMSLNDDDMQLYKFTPVDFADKEWFGEWVSKDLGVYVDVTKRMDVPALKTNDVSIVVNGGRSEGSVYLDAITIEYDEAPGMKLKSPLGWKYEKLTKKSILTEGDEVMIYRNGSAAADFNGIEKYSYLDVVSVLSTADVADPDVLRFTLNKTADMAHWTFTDQHGRKLGVTGKQSLAWNEGSTEWTVELGYDGATITNANAEYGTMRYSTPDNSYARFNMYTSKTLLLPFLYRKGEQNSPEQSRSLTFDETAMTVELDEAHVALRPTLLPKTTTDKRIRWSSTDESVATVNGGYVTLHGVGTTTITATAYDGGAESSIILTVTKPTGIKAAHTETKNEGARKVMENNRVVIKTEKGQWSVDGGRES